MFLGPIFIRYMQKKQMKQVIRDDGPQSHLSKKGTPTMGGALILIGIVIPTLLWADLSNHLVWACLFITTAYGAIGYVDDYRKVIQKNPKGLPGKQKLFWQIVLSSIALVVLYKYFDMSGEVYVPFFKEVAIDLKWFYIPFAVLVITGSSNAVNLTDGLDGLAVGPTITTSVTFLLLAYCAGHYEISKYLQIPHIPGSGEITVFLATVAASCLGFLWYNTYPAQVFMGDIGSLSLGGALGIAAVLTKNEFLLALCGGVFVVEALSVMIQVASFKLTGKRVFKMAPIHHHFELKGWPEPKVIVRFWIISILLALITLSTLKLR